MLCSHGEGNGQQDFYRNTKRKRVTVGGRGSAGWDERCSGYKMLQELVQGLEWIGLSRWKNVSKPSKEDTVILVTKGTVGRMELRRK